MDNISKHITYEEATKSQTAVRLGIKNEPNKQELEAMKYVAENIFEKVRAFVGGALHVSSFFRSKKLNTEVPGSSKTSQHMLGEAMDLDCDTFGNSSNNAIFDYITKNLNFDQCIGEYPDKTGKWAWVHVSLKKTGKNRKQILVKLKDKYIPFSNFKVGMV